MNSQNIGVTLGIIAIVVSLSSLIAPVREWRNHNTLRFVRWIFGPKLIQAVLVVRDSEGYWSHPGMPDFNEDTPQSEYLAWVEAQGLELSIDSLEDYDEHPAFERYFENGSPDIGDWTPEQPRGDGWFILSIHMTEDSAVWVWARRKTKEQR
ncbi:hypothetical protein [Herbaspirillum sp. NPDC101397]|uniref:hypothetical protein n=1 Tax=Herbaspirillum sp. NPDC101397 TaxID=3364006 RepID=UPI00383A5E24